MVKSIALDTNIAIQLLNGDKSVLDAIQNYEVICLPVIVCGELLFGAKNSTRKKENEYKYREFISNCVILNINALIADKYSEIRLELKKTGNPIPENDIWIAAICKVNNLPLLTLDKHFSFIKSLELKS